MRLIVARCEVSYAGRLTTVPARGGAAADAQGRRHLHGVGRRRRTERQAAELDDPADRGRGGAPTRRSAAAAGRAQAARRRIGWRSTIAEVLSDVEHELDALAALEKEGVERELQELLADAPQWCGEGLRLVRREWPTDIGPVDLMCRDATDEWIAVEIKRIATIDAVEQLTRYLERIRLDPALGSCRGVLAAQVIKPQARVLAQARGIDCVEVDLERAARRARAGADAVRGLTLGAPSPEGPIHHAMGTLATGIFDQLLEQLRLSRRVCVRGRREPRDPGARRDDADHRGDLRRRDAQPLHSRGHRSVDRRRDHRRQPRLPRRGTRAACRCSGATGATSRIDERRLKLARYLFFRYGGRVVFFGRFISILRTYAGLLRRCEPDAMAALLPLQRRGRDHLVVGLWPRRLLWPARLQEPEHALDIALVVVALAAIATLVRFVRGHAERLSEQAELAFPDPD